jgi:hypothetical protein
LNPGDVERKQNRLRFQSQSLEEDLSDLPTIARGVERCRRLGLRIGEDLVRLALGKPLAGEMGTDGRSLRVSENALRVGRKQHCLYERRVEEYLRGNDNALDGDGYYLVPPAKVLAKWTACRGARSVYSANDFLRKAGLIDTKTEKCIGVRDDDTIAVWSRLGLRQAPDRMLSLAWELKKRRKKLHDRLRARGKEDWAFEPDRETKEQAVLRRFTLYNHKDLLLVSRGRRLPGESGFDGRVDRYTMAGARLLKYLLHRIGFGCKARLDVTQVARRLGWTNESTHRAAAELRKGGVITSKQVRYQWEVEIPASRLHELGQKLVERSAHAARIAHKMGLNFRTSVNCHVDLHQKACAVASSFDASKSTIPGSSFPGERRSQDLPPLRAAGQSFAFYPEENPGASIDDRTSIEPRAKSSDDLELERVLSILKEAFSGSEFEVIGMDRIKKLIHRQMHAPVNPLTATILKKVVESESNSFSRYQAGSLSMGGDPVQFLSNWPGYCRTHRVDALFEQCRIRGQFLAEHKQYAYHFPSEILGGKGSPGFINVARDAVDRNRQPSQDLEIAPLVSAAIGNCDFGPRIAPVVEFDSEVREYLEKKYGISFSAIYKAAHDPQNYRRDRGIGFEDRVVEAIRNSPRGQEEMAQNAHKRFLQNLHNHLKHGRRPAPPGHWEFVQNDGSRQQGLSGKLVWVEEEREGNWNIDDLALCDLAGLRERFAMIARELASALDILEYYSCSLQWGDRFINAVGLPMHEHANRMAKARKIVLRAQVYQAVLSDHTDEAGNPVTGGHSKYDIAQEEAFSD